MMPTRVGTICRWYYEPIIKQTSLFITEKTQIPEAQAIIRAKRLDDLLEIELDHAKLSAKYIKLLS